MTSIVTRHFVTVGDRQIHYRRAGHGPPVVLLHQSPTSSRDCEPLLQRLADRHSVFAPDMPGYGASDPLTKRDVTIEMLADNVAIFMDALDIAVAGVYGFHTGASVATSFARRHSARVSATVAVGLSCLTAEERTRFLKDYLVPFVPAWDGSHLAWLWSRLKDQSIFFPWFERTAAARVAMDASSPAVVQVNIPDWLRSGDRYREAYAAAFRYGPESDLAAIRTPHFVVDYQTDPLFAHLERLPMAQGTVQIVRCATAVDAQHIVCDVFRRYPGVTLTRTSTATRPLVGKTWQDYVTVSGTQLRVLRAGVTSERPVLLQHGAQSSAMACGGLIDALAGHRSVIAVELPGHGESDALPDSSAYSMQELADLMAGAVAALGVTEAELIGLEAGAAIHVALAAQGSLKVARLALVGALDTTHDSVLRQCLLDGYASPESPDFFGGHLLRAWHAARDHLLFFPWTECRRHCAVRGDPRLDAHSVHRATVDSILAGEAGSAIRRAETVYPLLSQLATLRCSATFAAPRWLPRFGHTQEAAARAGSVFVELPSNEDEWSRMLAP